MIWIETAIVLGRRETVVIKKTTLTILVSRKVRTGTVIMRTKSVTVLVRTETILMTKEPVSGLLKTENVFLRTEYSRCLFNDGDCE